MRARLHPSELDYVTLYAGQNAETDIWAQANQYPLQPGAARLILIRDAEQLSQWDKLTGWLRHVRHLPNVYLVFVSNESDLASTGTGKNKALKAHLAALRAPRGSLVRCTSPSEDDAVAWVRRRCGGLDDPTARYLLTRTGGNLAEAAHTCAKLNLFSGPVSKMSIDALSNERPSVDFADHLIALDRRKALLAIPEASEYTKTIALLDSRLDLLRTLHRVQLAGRSWRDTMGVNPYLARRYLPFARSYDPAACASRRRLLAVLDDAVRGGARTAVFEALVALW